MIDCRRRHKPSNPFILVPVMPVVKVRIPQIGEGLQEARLVAVLKQPGDAVKRDEPIYQMETDKAVMDVESPYDGVLESWLAQVDTILPIGAAVAEMAVADGVKEMEVHGASAEAGEAVAASASQSAAAGTGDGGGRNAMIPPRTRAYAKEKGISEDQLASIPAASGKLMPGDIDAFLSGGAAPAAATSAQAAASAASAAKAASGLGVGGSYQEIELNQKQRLLASRLQRGTQLVVPGTISVAVDWEPLEHLKSRMKSMGGDFQPSLFTCFAYGVVLALKEFPMFRSTLRGDDVLRTYDHANLGVAVALPGDELVLAVVEQADSLGWPSFAHKLREQVELARAGNDQANESVTISLTNMQGFGLRDAVPVVVPPSIATLFIGEVYNGLVNDINEVEMRRMVNLALTFDHRVINGVGAANFVNRIKQITETISRYILTG